MKDRQKNFVSCVLYLHNDGDEAVAFLDRVKKIMEEQFEKYEIICVDDASDDDTVAKVQSYVKGAEKMKSVSLIRMGYYQGLEASMNAGRDLAVGDYIYEFDKILFDYDESLIMDAYKKALTGFDIVAVCPKKHVSVSSKLFYLLYNWANKSPNKLQQERFRVISRRAVNRINQLNSYIPYRKAMYVNCGLNRASIEYESTCKAKKGSTKLEKSSRSDLAFDSFIIFTDIMEKISFFLCALFLLVMIVMAGYVGYSVFSEVRPVEGWMSTIGLISFGFFGVFLLLTLILKYLSVILNLIFRKQRYVISGVEKLTK